MYQVQNPADRATGGMGQAANTLSAMQQQRETKTKAPGHSVGGAIGGAMGGAATGALIGAEIGAVGGPMGAGIGAALGAASYLFS